MNREESLVEKAQPVRLAHFVSRQRVGPLCEMQRKRSRAAAGRKDLVEIALEPQRMCASNTGNPNGEVAIKGRFPPVMMDGGRRTTEKILERPEEERRLARQTPKMR